MSRRFFDPGEGMSSAELDAARDELLLGRLEEVVTQSALHREAWASAGVSPADIESIDDFTRLAPFVSKEAVRDFARRTGDPLGGMFVGPAAGRDYVTSSGTSGRPTLHANTAADLEWQTKQAARNYFAAGVRPGDTVAYALPAWARPFLGNYEGFKALGCDVAMLDWFDHNRLLSTIAEVDARAFFMASAPLLGELDPKARDEAGMPAPLGPGLEILIWGGDVLTASARRRLAERWQARIYNNAGLGDLAMVCVECEAQAGVHAWGDLFFLEVIDPATQAVVTGVERRGELVITSLHGGSQPHLRWRTGDVATLFTGTCECGRSHPRFVIHGRLSDEIAIGEVALTPNELRETVEGIEGLEHGFFQIGQAKGEAPASELVLRVAWFEDEDADRAEAERSLVDGVTARIGLEPTIEWATLEVLARGAPPHKIRRTFVLGE